MANLFVWFYRFITGHHMDGKVRRHPQTGKVKPAFKNYWWNRYSRPKRARIRLMFVAVFVGLIIGRIQDWWLTTYAVSAITPFVVWRVWLKLLNEVSTIRRFHDSDGAMTQYRALRPKYWRKLETIKGWRFRLRPPLIESMDPNSPEARALMAENMEAGGEPVTRLARPLGIAELQLTEGAPKDRRTRSFKRAGQRRGA